MVSTPTQDLQFHRAPPGGRAERKECSEAFLDQRQGHRGPQRTWASEFPSSRQGPPSFVPGRWGAQGEDVPYTAGAGMFPLHLLPGQAPPGPSAPQPLRRLDSPEPPTRSLQVTRAQVPLGTYLGTVHSLVCLSWGTRT